MFNRRLALMCASLALIAGRAGAAAVQIGLQTPGGQPVPLTPDPNGHLPVSVYDATTGLAVSNTTPVQVTLVPGGGAGSRGNDFSGNTPALPVVGSNFGGSGPYAGWVLLKSVAASNTRVNIDVENTAGAPIAILRDDGSAAAGAAPVNASIIPIAGGAGAGVQGGAWSSNTFKGRLQIYAASLAAQVAVFAEDGTPSVDYSANPPTLPVVGSSFGGSGPYANYVLVTTAAALSTRANIEIDNASGAQIAVVRDDGTAATGAAPVNASVFALAGGAGAGAQGGSWSSASFKGRVQIYAPVSTAQVTIIAD